MIGDLFLNTHREIERTLSMVPFLGASTIAPSGGERSFDGNDRYVPLGEIRLMGHASPTLTSLEVLRWRTDQHVAWAESETKCREWR